MKDLVQELGEREGPNYESCDSGNSTYKDLFAGIRFSEKLGSSVQIYFSFMAETLENHYKL